MLTQNGLTLLEVLVSMLVLALGILGMAPLVVLSIEGNSISQDILTASELAKEKIEQYENASILPSLPFEETESNLDNGYNRLTRIYENTADTTLPANVCFLQITISWLDHVGQYRSTTYSTILEKG